MSHRGPHDVGISKQRRLDPYLKRFGSGGFFHFNARNGQ
jgi:hypothetical protein